MARDKWGIMNDIIPCTEGYPVSETVMPSSTRPDEEPISPSVMTTKEKLGGEAEPVRWEIVARTSGLLAAQIKAGRLQAEGIPVRAWAESAGVAYGLTVGLLGTGYVGVPEEYVDQAQEILAEEFDEEE